MLQHCTDPSLIIDATRPHLACLGPRWARWGCSSHSPFWWSTISSVLGCALHWPCGDPLGLAWLHHSRILSHPCINHIHDQSSRAFPPPCIHSPAPSREKACAGSLPPSSFWPGGSPTGSSCRWAPSPTPPHEGTRKHRNGGGRARPRRRCCTPPPHPLVAMRRVLIVEPPHPPPHTRLFPTTESPSPTSCPWSWKASSIQPSKCMGSWMREEDGLALIEERMGKSRTWTPARATHRFS